MLAIVAVNQYSAVWRVEDEAGFAVELDVSRTETPLMTAESDPWPIIADLISACQQRGRHSRVVLLANVLCSLLLVLHAVNLGAVNEIVSRRVDGLRRRDHSLRR